jgi:hypothetical protein
MKSERMRWTGQVQRVRQMEIMCYKILVREPNLGVENVILKEVLKQWGVYTKFFYGMPAVVYLFDSGLSKVSLHNNVLKHNETKQTLQYQLFFYFYRLTTLHVSTLSFGHFQAYVNTIINY